MTLKLVSDGKMPPVMYYIYDGEQKLAITTKEAGEKIIEIQKDAVFMANIWMQIQEDGSDMFIRAHGDPDGVDFVAKRILASQEKEETS